VGRDAIRALWEHALANAPTFEPLRLLDQPEIGPPAQR
jgi:hypothetical protein